MLLKRKRGAVAIAFVVGEAWLTIAEVVMAARQSTQVNMLCQRPIHTHSSMSVAQLISSHLVKKTAKKSKYFFSSRPVVLVQWPERYYRELTLQRPPKLTLTGNGLAALLADAGFNPKEWRWDVQVNQGHCQFLLMKLTDYHEIYHALQEHRCPPDVIGWTPRPDTLQFNFSHSGAWPDIAATQQAVHLAVQYFTGH
ncbi:hypothetical protein CWE15_10615 [Aliidiomarina taiwanensis]|uniref:Uncharacterized protein n=1 Tax=Aliidiomarina taiwanensis TaxID=946228 RepID=A0A432WW22_9GAMM|nr:hypothetical protein [Aliidiomarina taiwanensis]RUO37963.1 hypothetical protein CWE15_10615 [Aliidiomarina taiwanensis]